MGRRGNLSNLTVPPTIAGLLQARLDRLSPEEQRVIERGSVEGRVFHWGSVTELSSDLSAGDVGRQLMSLRRRDLIGPEEALFGGSEAFGFRHALIRDAAYERIPKRTRSELHEGHARWLERVAGERVTEFEEVLAYHLEQAYRLRSDLGPVDERGRELAAEAARRLETSSRRAVARGDMPAASTMLDRAAGLLGQDDPGRIDVLLLLGTAATQAGDLERAQAALDEGLDASTRMGDRRREIRARLARFQLLTATQPEGVTVQIEREAQAAIPVLEELGDDEGLARAWNSICEVGLMWCHASDIEHASERAAHHAERAGDRAALSDALSWRMFAPWLGMAPPAEAILRCEEVRARAPDDRLLEAITTSVEGSCDGMLGRFDDGRRKQQRAQAILVDLGVKLNIGGMSQWAGSFEAMAGDLEAADRVHREGIDVLESIGEIGYLSTHLGYHGRVLYELGRFDEAAEKADLAERLGASDDVATQTIWRQLRAKLLAREGHTDAAVALAEEAVSMTDGTDCWDTLTMAFEDLGDVYALVGRTDDAIRADQDGARCLRTQGGDRPRRHAPFARSVPSTYPELRPEIRAEATAGGVVPEPGGYSPPGGSERSAGC